MRAVNLSALGLTSAAALSVAASSHNACQCGYYVTSPDTHVKALFTDALETDFLHLHGGFPQGAGWVPQAYDASPSPADGNGSMGMTAQPQNLAANFIEDANDWAGPGIIGPDPGLQLWVRRQLVVAEGEELVPTAEIVSSRDDMLYGSFRIAMKTTQVNGTCASFYVYYNDTQAIDIEILSREQLDDRSNWPVHLVSQNTTVANATTSNNGTYNMAWPPSGPGADYHEYRFDWLPDRIGFYVDSTLMWVHAHDIPRTPSRIHIEHWSNGDPSWSGGPPAEDAKMTVSYVKAYFNSSDPTRNSDYSHACSSDDGAALLERTCDVANQDMAPTPVNVSGLTTGKTPFLSFNSSNSNGQSGSGGGQTETDDPKKSASTCIDEIGGYLFATVAVLAAVIFVNVV